MRSQRLLVATTQIGAHFFARTCGARRRTGASLSACYLSTMSIRIFLCVCACDVCAQCQSSINQYQPFTTTRAQPHTLFLRMHFSASTHTQRPEVLRDDISLSTILWSLLLMSAATIRCMLMQRFSFPKSLSPPTCNCKSMNCFFCRSGGGQHGGQCTSAYQHNTCREVQQVHMHTLYLFTIFTAVSRKLVYRSARQGLTLNASRRASTLVSHALDPTSFSKP